MMRFALVIPLLLSCVSCTTTVNLTVKNLTDIHQAAHVAIQSENGIEKERISLGNIEPRGETKRSLRIRDSSSLMVRSSTEAGYQVWESGPYTVQSKLDPCSLQVELGLRAQYLPNDFDALHQIRTALSELGPNVGFEPLPIKKGLSTWFGALVVIVPPSKKQPGMKLLYHVRPGHFFERAVTSDEFQYPSSTSSATIHAIGKHSSALAGSLPLYGSIGVNPDSENLYQVRWSMMGYGRVIKKEPGNSSLMDAIGALANDKKEAIAEALSREKDAVLLYVNEMYVLKKADFFMEESSKLPTGAQLTASTYLTAEGAWSFESATESHQQYQDLVINVRGITLPVTVLKKKTRVLTKGTKRPRHEFIPTYIYQIKPSTEKSRPEYFITGEAQRHVKGRR